jgi:Domain of unknown function (DUF4333)
MITLAAAAVACAACGSLASSNPSLDSLIRSSLDAHRGLHVQSVACPAGPRGKGTVVHCSATLSGGHKVGVRAIALGNGAFRILTSEILPDNVERAIDSALARRNVNAKAVCPAHVRARIGETFECKVTTGGGRDGIATVTILNSDGDYRFDVR